MPQSLDTPRTIDEVQPPTSQAEVLALWNGSGACADDPAVSIARVRSGAEGMLESFCAAMNVGTLTVRYERVQYSKRADGTRRRDVQLRPLFGGHVFVGSGDRGRDAFSEFRKRFGVRSAYTRQDVRLAQQARLRDDLLKVTKIIDGHLCGGGLIALRPGVRVRVTRGYLMGEEGVIIREASGGRFVIPVEYFGRCVPAEVPVEDLEPLN